MNLDYTMIILVQLIDMQQSNVNLVFYLSFIFFWTGMEVIPYTPTVPTCYLCPFSCPLLISHTLASFCPCFGVPFGLYLNWIAYCWQFCLWRKLHYMLTF